MRRILSIALALAGIFVSVMASPSKTTTEMDATENQVVGEGALGRQGMYLPTVAWLILKPSLSSSPWMRGAPQSRLARLILQTRSRISALVLGRPRRRDRQRQ